MQLCIRTCSVTSNVAVTFLSQEYHGEDLSDLYLDEREESLKQAQDEKRRVQISVPGILNPYDMPEEMQD